MDNKNKKKGRIMATKHISLAIGSIYDHVNEAGGNQYDCTVQQLANDPENGFYLDTNPNGQTDLCIEVEDTAPDMEAELAEYGTNNIYNIVSNDFIGGRPTTRCPKCVN